MTEPVKLITTKPDAEVAAEIKKETMEAVAPLLAALNKARELGFVVNINFGPDFMSRTIVVGLQVSKVY